MKFVAAFVALFTICSVAFAQDGASKFNSAYLSYAPSWLTASAGESASFGNTVVAGWNQAHNLGTDELFIEYGAAFQFTQFHGTYQEHKSPFFYGIKMPVSLMVKIGDEDCSFAPYAGVDLMANLRNEFKNASGSFTNADMRDLSAAVHAGAKLYFTRLWIGAGYEYYFTDQFSDGGKMHFLNLMFGFTF